MSELVVVILPKPIHVHPSQPREVLPYIRVERRFRTLRTKEHFPPRVPPCYGYLSKFTLPKIYPYLPNPLSHNDLHTLPNSLALKYLTTRARCAISTMVERGYQLNVTFNMQTSRKAHYPKCPQATRY